MFGPPLGSLQTEGNPHQFGEIENWQAEDISVLPHLQVYLTEAT